MSPAGANRDPPESPDGPLDPIDLIRLSRQSAAPKKRLGEATFQRFFVPVILAIAAEPWLFPAEGPNRMPATLLVTMVVIYCAEQIYPARPEWTVRPSRDGVAGLRRLGRDLFYLLVVALMSALLIRATSVPIESFLVPLGLGGADWLNLMPGPVRIIFLFLVMELFSYAMHRMAHNVSFFWRFHSTHHVIVEMDGLKAWRTHPIENFFFYIARAVPLVLIGASMDDVVTVTCLGGLLGILSHANLNIPHPLLGLVINLPNYHVVHHSADVEESRCNFGCHTVFWDRVFGTFREAPKEGLELGVHPVGRRTLWQELVWPLYRKMPTSSSSAD